MRGCADLGQESPSPRRRKWLGRDEWPWIEKPPARVPFEARGKPALPTGGRDKPRSEYCYLSDASVPSLPSLIGDEFLKFANKQGSGNIFSFVLKRLEGRRGSKGLESHVLKVVRRPASTPQERTRRGRKVMAPVSESHISDRAITDAEFELLLQKTYEMVQNQKSLHPLEPSAESTSWT
jgi:hypothetical protein